MPFRKKKLLVRSTCLEIYFVYLASVKAHGHYAAVKKRGGTSFSFIDLSRSVNQFAWVSIVSKSTTASYQPHDKA